ncbi:MAG: TIGR01777 family protein [Myxococcales bacterium]|nr:MAG: TIGR01777 family protein [Myxococcales bacterium]
MLRIAISGASGLIGAELARSLSAEGHSILPLVRRREQDASEAVFWDPAKGRIDSESLNGIDVMIHLAASNLGDGRWTPARKAEIVNSRVGGTSLLAKTLPALARPPNVWLCASAVGFYGSREPEDIVDEAAGPGTGFLAEVCRVWEQAAAPAVAAGLRTMFMRFGVVLAPHGGALAKLLPVFKLGLGGPIGNGRQMMSWVALDEIPSVVRHLIATEALAGPVNVVSPHPVPNREFARELGAALNRPAVLPAPAFALRLAFGEMAEETVLAGQNVKCGKLLESGYSFRWPDVGPALKAMLSARS